MSLLACMIYVGGAGAIWDACRRDGMGWFDSLWAAAAWPIALGAALAHITERNLPGRRVDT